MIRLVLLAWSALLLFVAPARAQSASDAVAVLCPSHGALAPIFQSAADRWRVPAAVLVAMARVESSCDSRAVNERTQSYGLLQIKLDGSANVDHLEAEELLDPETNVDLGARHLAKLLRLCGTLTGALGCYHGRRYCQDGKHDGYARRVTGLVKWAREKIQRLKEKRV